ncbi:MAG: class I SAM-dependent methyltransferase [Alphaproteobacteria bacterium]|nr:class I SAM-dependent methyltransferase [Alphaproteobacteria bacterium]
MLSTDIAEPAGDRPPGFRADSHDRVAAVEERSFWFRARNRLIVDLVRRYCPDLGSMIDVGCGTGLVLQGLRAAFPDARLVGAEALSSGLAQAEKRLGATAELVQVDAFHLPYADEFDVAGALDVLEHIDDDNAALGAIAATVRPGGLIMLTVPQHPWLWSAADEGACHRRRYRRGELEGKAAAAGLAIVASTSFVFALLPAMALTRGIGARQPEREHELPAPLGRALEAVLDAERRLIGCGMRFPVGGTRIVVARRP